MARFGGTLLLFTAWFMACGGEGAHNNAASAGAASSAGSSGASSQSGGAGAAPEAGGKAPTAGTTAQASAGTAGAAGASSGGATSGGATSAGAAGAAGGGIVTPEMLVPTVAAFCATARACCAEQADPVHLDNCESIYATRDQTPQMLARGTITIDPADLAKCKAAYEAALTACEENSVLDACANIVHGKVAEGGACKAGSECAGDGPKVCLITGGQDSFGVCKATPAGKAGDECSATCRPNESCNWTVLGVPDSSLTPCLDTDGVFCDRDQVPAKCQPVHALAAPCDNDDQCGFSAYCDSIGSQTCKRRGQLNEACGTCIPSLQCNNGKCQSPPFTVGSTCDGYTLGPY